jgi:AcrR family transcriptional regulator
LFNLFWGAKNLVKNQIISGGQRRREQLRDTLVTAAERRIAHDGLRNLRARELAADAGCAVGAIYNAVADLDELILLANARTLHALEHALVTAATDDGKTSNDSAIVTLVRLAHAYLTFAATDQLRWRALFDHRMPRVQSIPDWYREEQHRLFRQVEAPLRRLIPQASAKRRALLARTLFAAVHGIVGLGLEEKLQAIPLPTLREQITLIVTTLGRGLATAT